MPSPQGMRSGRAFVELFAADSKLVHGRRVAERKLKSFGASVRNAGLKMAGLGMAVLDQKRAVPGAQGPLGDFPITNFSRNESLEEAIVADVTTKLAVFVEWHEVA